jgi:hypothetical protein
LASGDTLEAAINHVMIREVFPSFHAGILALRKHIYSLSLITACYLRRDLTKCNSTSLIVKIFITHRMDIENGVYFVDHGQGLMYFMRSGLNYPSYSFPDELMLFPF